VPDADALAEAAGRYFIPEKMTCAEAMLMAGCSCLGITSDIVPDVALGLGGGIGFQGKVCGILTGGAMVLSLAIAPREAEYEPRKMRVLAAVGTYVQRFEKEFKSLDCRTISKLDLTTAEGRKALVSGVKAKTCAPLVEKNARMIAEIIAEDAKRTPAKTT
jgi:C_GCAxxG_C_C family probable redox protein